MAQVTVYLDDELEAQMRGAAEEARLSQSRWLARLIEERLTDRWPEDVVKLAGAWEDFPEAESIRQQQGTDVPRDAF